MRYNKGFASLVVLLIIIGVLAVGGVAYFAGKNSAPKNEVSDNSDYYPPVNENQNPTTTTNNEPPASKNLTTNAAVVAEWKSLSSSALFTISAKENIYLESDFGITLGETVDLTGDGLHEGVFGGNGGNNELSFVLVKGVDGKNFVAKQKNKDGTTDPVQLVSVGRVAVQETYKLLPNERGFYAASLSYDEATDKFKCNTNGVSAYSWNSSTKLFEWNQSLTTKYTAQVCN